MLRLTPPRRPGNCCDRCSRIPALPRKGGRGRVKQKDLPVACGFLWERWVWNGEAPPDFHGLGEQGLEGLHETRHSYLGVALTSLGGKSVPPVTRASDIRQGAFPLWGVRYNKAL